MKSSKKYTEIFKDSHIYELLAEESPNWICIISSNRIIYGNKQFLKDIGYKTKLSRTKGVRLTSIIAARDKKSVAESLENAINKGETSPLEFHLIKENGTRVDVVQINRVIQYNGDAALFSMMIPVSDLSAISTSGKALKESEEQYRMLVENSTDVIYKTDLHGNYTFANQAFLKQTGYNSSEIIKMNCFELIVKEFHDEVKTVYSNQLEKGTNDVVSLEMPCIYKDKSITWIEQHSRLEFDDFGKPIGYFLTARDITEKHETEKVLTQERRALKEDYKTLVETMNEGIVRVDRKETILYVNKRFCEMFGFTEKETNGKNIIDLLILDNDSKKRIRAAFDLREKGKPSSYHVMAKKKSGEIVWCSINGSPIQENGKVIGSMGIVMDITEEVNTKKALTDSENNLKMAQEIGRLGTYEWDIASGNLTWNKQMYKIYGVNNNVKPTLELSLRLIHPDDQEKLNNAVENAIQGKTNPFFDYRILRKDGTTRYCLARSRAFFDEAGKTEKIMGTIQDITEQKLAEQEIQELNESLEKRVINRTEQLEKANKEIRALLQEMHHRVKNNLQIVSSLMNLQANSIKEKKSAGIFEESRDRIYAMAIIHENLYLGESVSEINLQEYIKPLIEGRIRANQTMDKKLALDLSIPNAYFNIGAVLPLGLLLNELVTNTIKHAFPKGREGLITLSIKKVRGGEYKLEYSDNGIGFEEGGDYQSLGLVLIDSFVMQIDGVLTRKSNSKGTHYTIVFSMDA